MINQQTLNRLSQMLSNENIVWGIGGSYLLQLYNLYSNPNDLDVWVKPSDMPKVRQLFRAYEEIETEIASLPPKYHFKMRFYDVEVDFVACFIVKPNQKTFTYHISPQNIDYLMLDNNVEIPCTFLEDWYIVYKLLKRNEKAKIIEDVFREKRIKMSERALDLSITSKHNTIPKYIIKDASNLIFSSLQLSLFDPIPQPEENENAR